MTNRRPFYRMLLPTRTIGHYAARLYFTRFLGILLGLVAVLQMLDMMAVRDDIMAADGATVASMGNYFMLRLPQLLSQFIPFSALLATLLVLAALNQHSEIIVMKASGMSAHLILFPLGLVSLLIGTAHFAFNEVYVVGQTAKLQYWQDNAYALNLPPQPEYSVNARLVEDNTLILVDAVTRSGNATVLDKVTLYQLDERGNVTLMTRANFALHNKGRWTLFEVSEFDPDSHTMENTDNRVWDVSIEPDRFLVATVKPDQVGVTTLAGAIERLRNEGAPTASLMVSFFHKFMEPASSLLMPLLAAIAGFGVHRRGTLLIRVVLGMALGFAFFVADNFMLAMGQFGVAPPFLAATTPFFLFSSIGLAVLLFTEE